MPRFDSPLAARWSVAAFAAAAALFAAGCPDGVGNGFATPCDTDDDCLPGQWCDIDSSLCAGEPTDLPDAVSGACVTIEDCWQFEDGDLCNGFLTCAGGQCVPDPSTVVTCPASHPCQPNVCNPATGYCEATVVPGCSVDDECFGDNDCPSSPCAVGACVNGRCTTSPLGCNDGDECTDDFCDPAVGCRFEYNDTLPGCGDPPECQFDWQCDVSGNGDSICVYARCDNGRCVDVFEPTAEDCNDGQDNDCDGLTDCDDADCNGPACGTCASNPIKLSCDTSTTVLGLWSGAGIDNYSCSSVSAKSQEIAFTFTHPKDATVILSADAKPAQDSLVYFLVGDCSGDACQDVTPLSEVLEMPFDVLANVPYYFVIDRVSPDSVFEAEFVVYCPDVELCQDFVDNDNDGLTDCADPDCVGQAPCLPTEDPGCNDGLDNNGDGLIDCADPWCQGHPNCALPFEICGDGVDNDGDGLTDCADPECDGLPICPKPEVCDDNVDNDFDGTTDCGDSDCFGSPLCQPSMCTVAMEIGCGPMGGISSVSNSLEEYSCLPPGLFGPGADIVLSFVAPFTGSYNFEGVVGNSPLAVLVLDGACDGETCIAGAPTPSIGGQMVAGQTLYFVLEPIDGASSVTLEGGFMDCAPLVEICGDGIDNDGNGLADCGDPACFGAPDCGVQLCEPVADASCGTALGGLVGSGTSLVDTYSCLPGTYPGEEVAFYFESPVDTTVQWSAQTFPPDATLIVLQEDCFGNNCWAAAPIASDGLLIDLPGGVPFYFVVDSQQPGPVIVFDSLFECLGGGSVTQTCSGGGCDQVCTVNNVCQMDCGGGGCFQLCEPGAECTLTCPGGGCAQICLPGASCDVSCQGGGCTN